MSKDFVEFVDGVAARFFSFTIFLVLIACNGSLFLNLAIRQSRVDKPVNKKDEFPQAYF